MILTSYLNFLSRNKGYTLINVLGLSVSLMFVIVIWLYYGHESSTDAHLPDADRIALLRPAGGRWSGTNMATIPMLLKGVPHIEAGCPVYVMPGMHTSTPGGDNAFLTDVLLTDSCFFSFFGFPLLEGDAPTCLATQQQVVISERLARRLFPGENALGQSICFGEERFSVSGVYRPDTRTSLPQSDVVMQMEILRSSMPYMLDLKGNFGSAEVYLKLSPGTDPASLDGQVDKVLQSFYGLPQCVKVFGEMQFQLLPLRQCYYSGLGSLQCRRGDSTALHLISLMGLAILFFAVSNYINLTVAQSGSRACEMATRRLLGSQRSAVEWRLMAESALMCVMAVVLALALTLAALPCARQVLSSEFSPSQLAAPLPIALMVLLTAALSAVSGFVPSRLIASVRPIDVVRGTFRLKSRTTLGHTFMCVQHFITICLVALAGILSHQTIHLISAPLGYDTDSLLCFSIEMDATKADLLKRRVAALPGVVAATVCMDDPLGGGHNQMGEAADGTSIRFQRLYGDADYLRVLGMEMTQRFEGSPGVRHLFGEMQTFVMEGFYETTGLPQGTTSFRWHQSDADMMPIDGVMPRFKFGTATTKEDKKAYILYMARPGTELHADLVRHLMVRVGGDKRALMAQIEEIYHDVYRESFSEPRPWFADKLRHVFAQERRTSQLMLAFAAVAMLISILGLTAMSTYHIRQRRKETALRKVFGAQVAQVRRRLVGQFLRHVAVAAVPTVPVVWWAAQRLLRDETYRIVWWPWMPVAIAAVLLVSWLAVSLQSWQAAAERPMNQLRDIE